MIGLCSREVVIVHLQVGAAAAVVERAALGGGGCLFTIVMRLFQEFKLVVVERVQERVVGVGAAHRRRGAGEEARRDRRRVRQTTK